MIAEDTIAFLDEFEYVRDLPSNYIKTQFEQIISPISGGRVLDMGCGPVGDYWALGYAHRVDSITYFDKNPEFIDFLRRRFDTLSPESLKMLYSPTISYLKDAGLAPATADEIFHAENLLRTYSGVYEFDFLEGNNLERFDHVIALEALEVVHSARQLKKALSTVRALLNDSGVLRGVLIRFESLTPKVSHCADNYVIGTLNPGAELFSSTATECGFKIKRVEAIPTGLGGNYTEAVLFELCASSVQD